MAKETIASREIPSRVHFTRIEDTLIEKKVPKKVLAEYTRVYGADMKTVGIFVAKVSGKGSFYAFEAKAKSGASRDRTVIFYDVLKGAIVGFGKMEHMPNAEEGGVSQVVDTETVAA